MTVKRPPRDIPVILVGFGLAALVALAGCDVDDTTSRVPPDGGGGGGVDPGAAGEGEGEGEADGPGFISCVESDAAGNEHGVGRYCEPKGDECHGLRANFCAADFYPDETSTGCMFSCTASEECGEGATCRPASDPEEVGGECVPTECLAIEG